MDIHQILYCFAYISWWGSFALLRSRLPTGGWRTKGHSPSRWKVARFKQTLSKQLHSSLDELTQAHIVRRMVVDLTGKGLAEEMSSRVRCPAECSDVPTKTLGVAVAFFCGGTPFIGSKLPHFLRGYFYVVEYLYGHYEFCLISQDSLEGLRFGVRWRVYLEWVLGNIGTQKNSPCTVQGYIYISINFFHFSLFRLTPSYYHHCPVLFRSQLNWDWSTVYLHAHSDSSNKCKNALKMCIKL